MLKRLFILFFFFYISVSQLVASNFGFDKPFNVDTLKQRSWVDSLMKTMTLHEKIAQSVMVAAFSNKDQKHIDEISALVRNEQIGGLCFFQGGPVRQARLTNLYQSMVKIPLLISIDGEWGLGMRLDSTVSFPKQMMLGAAADPNLVYQIAADIAKQLRRMGIQMNFAPVVDVNNNPQNPVISTRSFGEDRNMVAQFGLEYMKGLQYNGILACAKHFPGHGDTDADSHFALPKINHPYHRLDSLEFYPFKELINNSVDAVMIAHLRVPTLEKDSTLASSFSTSVIKGVLGDSLKFKGLIFTDALNMKGASNLRNPVELNYLAYKAGNDFLLYPEKAKESIDYIENEVKKGNFAEDEVNKKCRKILMAKYRVGLSKYKPVAIENLVFDLNKPSSEVLRRKAIEGGIILLTGKDIIPLKRLDTLRIAYVEVGKTKGTSFRDQLEAYTSISSFSINPESTVNSYDSLLTVLDTFNLVIVGYHSTELKVAKNYGVSEQSANFIFDLSSRKKVIVDIFGNPYTVNRILNIPSLSGLVVSFDNSNLTQSLSAQMIFGGIGAVGILPASASKSFLIGSGIIQKERTRLKYSIPEELGINSNDLLKVDSIALNAISNGVTPGMQILVAKDGVVFYNKSFGYFTYCNETPVTPQSIYDIASVTKVTSTLPSVMHLYEMDSIKLKGSLDDYLNFPKKSNKRDILIKDMLLHQSGLVPWLPYYISTLSTLIPGKPAISSTLSTDYPFMFSEYIYISKYSIPSPVFYSKKFSEVNPFQVAENIYAIKGMKDSIYNRMDISELKDVGKYKYSDLNFIYLQRIVEKLTGKGLDQYADQKFYKHLGMNITSYQPLKKFNCERIVPTEDDLIFRKQILTGYVHDPTAAMLGGVSGHAGLFSTANDLAKLMQMYLQKGEYGGEKYFESSTVDLFTTTAKDNNGNRRALGFDKPETKKGKPSPACESASPLSFGHSGFTGTMVWADPENGVVFIFLSNRVYPDAANTKIVDQNIRTNIQEVFYKAIKSSK